MDEILTVQEIAQYLKLSRTTIWRWCSEGKLDAFKVGRSWRIRRSALDDIMLRPLSAPGTPWHEEKQS